jgi:hypothetical protein
MEKRDVGRLRRIRHPVITFSADTPLEEGNF